MSTEVRQIALYGKGGIGKSHIACNVSVALAAMGHKVMQVGCSPKSDSVVFLNGGRVIDTTILEYSRTRGITYDTILETVGEGLNGVYIAEAGGPEPAEGCAGRGVAVALELLHKHEVFKRLDVEMVIYDVIGDVVCGGFGLPMRSGFANEVYIVSSGELMSLYSANNVCVAIADLQGKGADVGLAGIINNMRGVEKEAECMRAFCERLGVPLVGSVPRSDIVQEAEERGETVTYAFPNSEEALVYMTIAERMVADKQTSIPSPMELDEIMDILRKYQVLD